MKTYIGLNSDQFQQVLDAVTPRMLPIIKDPKSIGLALYIYLMKLRTNHTLMQIAPIFNISHSQVGTLIRKIRPIVHNTVVPLYLYNRSRQDLLDNTTPLSRKIYAVNNRKVVVTFDATYVFTIKSSNFDFQKSTYSKQFKRNLVKFMLCVSTNGLIAAAYGPFDARKNDATILNEIINEQGSVFQQLRAGDVVVVDRGFRDVGGALRNLGLIVKSPMGTKKNKLSRKNANTSRLATKTRYVVEVRNSHIKNIWKSLSGTKIHQSIPHLKMDFQVCAAFVNAFCADIKSDKYNWEETGDLMLSKHEQRNILSEFVQHIPNKSFKSVNNLTLFPKLSYADLRKISLGSYQIRLAKSYCQSHLRKNNNTFMINVCNDINLCKRYFKKLLKGSNPLLLSLDLSSRFQSGKHHKTYVLLEFFGGKYIVQAYCCSCRHGCRTVGCCAHVMLLIWYTLYIDVNNVEKYFPSSNLDRIFDKWQNEYSDIEAELNLNSNSDDSMESDDSIETDESIEFNHSSESNDSLRSDGSIESDESNEADASEDSN